MSLPPAARSAAGAGLARAPDGALVLQVCAQCAAVQYPPRECCGHCLADALAWQVVDGNATVLATTTLHHSLEPWFAARLPWTVASLLLDTGPVVFAHCTKELAVAGRRLRVGNARDPAGGGCLVAFAATTDDGEALQQALRTLGMGA